MPASVSTRCAYQLKITLKHCRPPVWRRIVVPADITLAVLHDAVQAAMGWENSHLHVFAKGRQQYGEPEPGAIFGAGPKDERKVRLNQVLTSEGDKLLYEYDFGDSWLHEIQLDEIHTGAPPWPPVCLAGKGACPPEDCGGVPGYYHFLDAMADRKHPEHREMRDWYGGKFDPAAFDLDEINARLQHLRRLA
jgi:hypothetical protein